MALSTHRVEVVPVVLQPHPNADSLSIVEVFGYTVCVRTADFKDRPLGAYLPPDSVVPDAPEFAFLGANRRIKVRRFRGVMSQGLLLPAPEGAQAGDDVAERLGITRYEPPVQAEIGGESETGPPGFFPKYDVESYFRYPHLLSAGEPVAAAEKVHGTSGRFVFAEGRLFAGSRTEWKKPGGERPNVWWAAAAQNPAIEAFCRARPGIAVYAEVYGWVQDLKYGLPKGRFGIAVFDLWENSRFLPAAEAREVGKELPWAPELFRGPFDAEKMKALSDGPSLIPGAKHLREGIVVRPETERTDPEIGRVILKIVSNAYLERA